MFDVAIIVVNYKMADYIRNCLLSLDKQFANSKLNIRVVIVDNNSRDHLSDVVYGTGMKNITVIFGEENRGYANAVNVGVRSVEAKYYFIVNPDLVFFEPFTIDRMYEYMEKNNRIGMLGPKLINPDGSLQYSCWRFPKTLVPLYRRTSLGNTWFGKKALSHFLMRDWDHKKTLPVDAIMGSAMFVRAESIHKAGLMRDDYFMYFEDMDWCRTFWSLYIPVYYKHDVRIRHVWRRDSAKIIGLKAVFLNPLTRTHIKSWAKYLWKWRGKKI